jgi:phosphohistidine phosphatase
MKVGFFRHGPAVPHGTSGIADADRPLTPEGRKKTAQAAKGLRVLDLGFDALYTSPLPRALQTAEILADILHLPKPKVLEALIPGTASGALLKDVHALKDESPLLVGHEPSLSAAVSRAVCGSAKGSFEMKKAGLAVVDFHEDSTSPEGTLCMLLTPSVLRDLGRS